VSQLDHDGVRAKDALEKLAPEDRAWLEERLAEYADLLQYLHDH
jgi:hypothetical protein